MKFMLLALAFCSLNAHALYINQVTPYGEDVDVSSEIRIEFDGDITVLGKTTEDVKDEQLAKVTLKPAIKCDWKYDGLKALKCTPKEKLVPNTKYEITITNGFQGSTIDNRTGHDQSYSFTSADLSILSYRTGWSIVEVYGTIVLNHAIKDEGLSGTIQCETKNYPAKVNTAMDGKVQVVEFRAPSKDLENQNCSFYFDKPISLLRYNLKSVPREKVILSRDVSEVGTSHSGANVYARCGNDSKNLNSVMIPQLSCEASERVIIETYPDNTNWMKLVKVTPSHGVKVAKGSYNQIEINGFRANSTYIITIPKSVSKQLKGNLVLQMDAVESPALLGSKKQVGVIERHGPWQVPFSAMNIQSLDVKYDLYTTPSGLANLENLQAQNPGDQTENIKLKLVDNQNTLLPFEIKDFTKGKDFKAGVIRGVVEVKDVDQKYIDAKNALVLNEWEQEYREKFKFGFLVTDIGLHMKVGKKGVLVWATSLKTGKPLKEVTVSIYSKGVEKQELKTDKDGLVFFKDVGTEDKRINVVAQLDDDISYIDTNHLWQRGIANYDFNIYSYYWEDTSLTGDVVAERPLYLPNEKVELKFIVREAIGDTLELKDVGEEMEVILNDSRGEEILKQKVKLNEFGTAVVAHQLDPKAVTGDYSATISVDKKKLTFDKAFSVQEFRKPEIKVAMDETNQNFTGKVTYYSGGDMKDAEGQVAVIFKGASFTPRDVTLKAFSYPKEVGGSEYYYDHYYHDTSTEILAREDVTTDEKGQFSLAKNKILNQVKRYGNLTVEAIFKDSAGGSVAGRITSQINPYKYIPGIDIDGWYFSAGDKVNPRVVAVDPNGKMAMGVKMELEVDQITWVYERRLGSGNYFYTDSKRVDKKLTSCTFTTNSNFKSCDITLKAGGEYAFKVKTVGQHNLSPATTWKWVMDDNDYLGFKVENHDRINIDVENDQLNIGDKVRLMAMVPFTDGEALVTFERNGIIHKEQVAFKGNVLIYEKELDDEKFIPGFYASIVVVKGRTSDKIDGELDLGKPQFKMGYAKVEVALAPKRLDVQVATNKPQVKPGEEIEVTVDVKDYKGKGSYSELAIAVVDDSLLSLAGNYKENYDVLDTFYKLRSLKVENYQTLTQLIGRRIYGKKGVNAGGGGGMAMRSDFKNTAYWVAQVNTNKKGKHTFKFKVPDNLTTWKVLIASVDEHHRFGFGETDFLATNQLTVEPVLPNFLMEGDKFLAQVSVANRSGEAQDVSVKAKSKALQVEKSEEKINLSNGSRSSVAFPMEVGQIKEADLAFTAEAKDHNDGFELKIPVERQSLQHVTYASGIVHDKKVSLSISLPGDLRKESLNMSVEYSHTAMNGLDEVFSYVLGYPYGCWEQRLSKAYFLVQYEQFKDSITYRFEEKEGSIKKAVQKLLDLAPDYQAKSGGMRYYPGGQDHADVYLSIFTAYSFNFMKKVGYKVNSEVEEKLKSYLKNLLTTDSSWSNYYDGGTKNSNKALVLKVLSEMGVKDLNTVGSKLYSDRNGLDLFALSFLGGYLTNTKGFEAEAKNVFGRLASLKVTGGNKLSYKEPIKTSNEWKWWSYTDTRSQCAVLQNMVDYTSDKVLVSSHVREILGRMKDGHWYNTQENIYCFEGLRRFVEKFESKNKEAELQITVDDNKIDKDPTKRHHLKIVSLNADELKNPPKKIELETKEKAELYYATILRFETPFKEREPISDGFTLKKEIYRKVGNEYKLLSGKVLKLKKGDTLKIKLNVYTHTDRFQVMLNDRLAAAFEPINMKLATASQADGAALEQVNDQGGYTDDEGNYYSPWFKGKGFEYVDLRLNAAQFYSRKLQAGSYDVEYLVQVRTAGEFTLPESQVEEMYYPEIRGTASGKKVMVEE